MKFAFFGYDFSASILYRLIQDGHEVMGIFCFETDNIFTFNNDARVIAKTYDVPFSTDQVDDAALKSLLDKGCECFISCGYPRKIPTSVLGDAYAINIHPTMLPEGKGIMPMPKLILDAPEQAGITVHKLTDQFDCGDILFQEKINVDPADDIETLSAKIMMRAPSIVSKIMGDLETYWRSACAQDGAGSWWSPYDQQKQSFDWSESVDVTAKKIRAFGRYGILAEFEGQRWLVRDARAWAEDHAHQPGTIVAGFSKQMALAITGGYVVLKELYPLSDIQNEMKESA